jgi:hypothetical protein
MAKKIKSLKARVRSLKMKVRKLKNSAKQNKNNKSSLYGKVTTERFKEIR